MKKFLIKVNGTQYEVEVEEVRDGAIQAPQAAATLGTTATPAAAPVAAPAPAASGTEKKAAADAPAGR